MKKLLVERDNNSITRVTGILTVIITGIMDFILFPIIEKNTEGIKAFDMNSFGYSYEQAEKFLELIGERGRNVYLKIQLPLDFVYPVIYTVFFETLITALSKKITPLLGIPAALFCFDYAENICSVVMLRDMKTTKALARTASTFTLIKSLLMYTTFLIIIVYFVLWNKARKEK